MTSKPGRPPTKGSYKKGNQLAKGNDKTLRTSTWIEKFLDLEVPKHMVDSIDYDEQITYRQHIAKRLLNTTVKSKKDEVALNYIKEVLDRTEGRPTQPIDHTSAGNPLGELSDEELERRISEYDQRRKRI